MAKRFDPTKITNLATDPIMDKVVGTLVDTSAEEKAPKPKRKSSSSPKKKPTTSKSKQKPTEPASSDERVLYNYRKEELEIDGVGIVQKVVSEKGRIIGRPSKATKEKKKPITLTLPPALYDKVKESASADHRTTSEYLAMIIEDYFNK